MSAHPRYVTPAVLPDLIEALASRDATVRFVASEILAALGPAAVPAIPALVQSMGEPPANKPWRNPGSCGRESFGPDRATHTDGGKGNNGVERGLAS